MPLMVLRESSDVPLVQKAADCSLRRIAMYLHYLDLNDLIRLSLRSPCAPCL